jgi:hypothetical protein
MPLSWAAKPAAIPEAIHEKLKMPFFLPRLAAALLSTLLLCYGCGCRVQAGRARTHVTVGFSEVFLSRPLLFFTVRLLIFISLSIYACTYYYYI